MCLLALQILTSVHVVCAGVERTPTPALDAEASRATPLVEEIDLQDGETYSGVIQAARIRVPEGSIAYVDGELVLHAKDELRVDGTLFVLDVTGLSPQHAPSVILQSGDLLTINGSVRGGRGRSLEHLPPAIAATMPGGDGSTITLSAPDVYVRGVVRAGDGGDGGPAGRGGNGGSIEQTGRRVTDRHHVPAGMESFPPAPVAWRAGDGGRGGASPTSASRSGDGGDSGGVTFEPHPNAPQRE